MLQSCYREAEDLQQFSFTKGKLCTGKFRTVKTGKPAQEAFKRGTIQFIVFISSRKGALFTMKYRFQSVCSTGLSFTTFQAFYVLADCSVSSHGSGAAGGGTHRNHWPLQVHVTGVSIPFPAPAHFLMVLGKLLTLSREAKAKEIIASALRGFQRESSE